VSAEGRYVRLRGVTLDHPPTTVPPVSVGVRGPKSLELAGQVADGTVIDWLSSAAYVRWARERIDAGRAAAGRTDAHRVTVYAAIAQDAGAEDAVRRAIGERRAQGGAQSAFLDAPLHDLALVGDTAAQKRALGALEEAGADCVVLVSPAPAVPLDPAALAPLLA
jgi:alkanesulfonate monooxygenase SsuD/methylene tetrahydromethanopterin reductase-like flavin-dependent oxidoreductase (luciferase family)